MARIGSRSDEQRHQAGTTRSTSLRAAVTVAIAVAIFSTGAVQGSVALAAQPGIATGAAVVEREPNQAGQRCFDATGTHRAETLIGNTFYKFTHSATFCTDGTNVVSVDDREHRFTDASDYASFGDVIEDSVSRMPASEVTSIKKARVDNCIPIKGCISSKYPFVRLTLRANGTWFATTGESEES